MTAEIAILNRAAVAMAADSAATVFFHRKGNGGEVEQVEKVFANADKIFALSYDQPVGIMVYSSSTYMGVPWETLIKTLRGRLGKSDFPTISEYASWFRESLLQTAHLIPVAFEEEHIESTIRFVLSGIVEAIVPHLVATGNNKLTAAHSKAATANLVANALAITMAGSLLPNVDAAKQGEIRTRIAPVVSRLISEHFPLLNSVDDATTLSSLEEIANNCFCRDLPEMVPFTGVVIAGFGSEQMVPELIGMHISGQLCGVLSWRQQERLSMDSDSARIVPFAQQDEVLSFCRGIHPEYVKQINDVGASLSSEIEGAIGGVLDKADASFRPVVQAATNAIAESWRKGCLGLMEFQQREFVVPIISIVNHLSKDQLAHMAESLVSLTSFRRKLSWGSETVGGPIDVAVITKGDGLVWVRRKHYFSPELNSHFFQD